MNNNIFYRTYPAVLLFFFALTLLCPYFSSHLPCFPFFFFLFFFFFPFFFFFFFFSFIFFSVTLLCPLFFYAYPAVPLFFYALTLLYRYFSAHLPCFHDFYPRALGIRASHLYVAFYFIRRPAGYIHPHRPARQPAAQG